ncbi:hypothetical protein SPF06_16825 [Sinomonas sp. JGH33]|uniref:Uncharacterized protein n=1 Tax=Sinomonas terricola TaxID=3110330 RepID=A0ABU5T9S3_9MICC|nr:hypothetical protein [Sinomonas sp. JGH33]MEA5456400.1 hypothetical protein [Sinomonas sp. JGH33]
MTQGLLLTDDEIVAVAMRWGRDWKASLPTLALDDDAELIRASARGHRSLFVRGLLGGPNNEELSNQVEQALGSAVGTLPELIGYAANSEDLRAATGLRFALFSTDAGEKVLVVTLPNGINEISRVSPADAQDFISTFAAGPGKVGAGSPAVVLVSPKTEDSTQFAVVTSEGTTSGSGPLSSLDLASGAPTPEVPAFVLAGDC